MLYCIVANNASLLGHGQRNVHSRSNTHPVCEVLCT